jgi:hypothetical protein
MKKLTLHLCFALCLAAVLAPQALAGYLIDGDVVDIGVGSPRLGALGGGPFVLTPQADPSRAIATFCLERNEYILPPYTGRVNISSGAVKGGYGGQSPPGSNFDPLSVATADLYLDWVSGAIALTGLGFNSSSGADNDQVQNVIWAFEGERIYYSNLNNLGKAIYDFFAGSTNGLSPSKLGDYAGGQVAVANMLDVNTGANLQSHLTLVPEPAAVAVWSVLGVVGLVLVKYRKRN